MAYGDDIDAVVGVTHRYALSANANDSVGTANGTNSGGLFTGVQLCEDTTNSFLTDGISDRITFPLGSGIEDATNEKLVCGWFSATAIQNPPKSIYGEGNTTTSFRFILGWGNALVFEIDTADFTIQIFGDVALEVDRAYHLTLVYNGVSNGNEVRAYVDGVKQLNSEPVSTAPGVNTIASRNVIELGDPAGSVSVGGTEVVLLAPINGQWAQWAMASGQTWTDAVIRDTLFEKGALPEVSISSGTESAMQASLTGEDNTSGLNRPLDIRINTVTGDGALSLTLDNRTFNSLSSVHIQYMGTGTLTVTNTNGSNASIGSTPNGGTIIFVTEVTVTVTCRDAATGASIEGAFVYLKDSSSVIVLSGLTNIGGVYTGTYGYITNSVISADSKVRKGTSSPVYKSSPIVGTLRNTGLNTTVLMVRDE